MLPLSRLLIVRKTLQSTIRPAFLISKCFSGKFSKQFVSKKSLERFHRRDGIPTSYDLIYSNDFPTYALSCQAVVFGGFVTGLVGFLIQAFDIRIDEPATETDAQYSNPSPSSTGAVVTPEKTKETSLLHDGRAAVEVKSVSESSKVSISVQELSEQVQQKEFALAISACCFFLLASLFRILSVLPMRVYRSQNKHCVAVTYGSFVPGKKKNLEFVAGHLRPITSKLPNLWGTQMYQDSSGKHMLLFESYFRLPSDFHSLLKSQGRERE